MAIVNIASPGRALGNIIVANPPGTPPANTDSVRIIDRPPGDKPFQAIDPGQRDEPDAGVRVKDDAIS